MIEQVDHLNIVVADLETMTAFYRDVLGLRVTKRVTISGDWIARVVGLDNVRAEVVYLDAPTGPRIELIKYCSPDGAHPAALGESNTKGLRHFAFRVGGLHPLVASLKQAGVKFLSGVEEVPDSQVSYAGGVRKRLLYFRDPEGNLLELCEYAA